MSEAETTTDVAFPEEERDRWFVSALARGLEVLRAFRPGDAGLGNQEIAARTGLPKPTVSRLAFTLTALGYLAYDPAVGKYRLAAGVLALGYAFLASVSLRDRARPLMRAMAVEVDAAVSLGARDRLSMIYLETCRGRSAITLRLDVGSRIPIATTAMGRALLAALPEDERAYLLEHVARRAPERFPRIRAGVERAVLDLARRGFVTSTGDWQRDVNAVGAPITAPDGSLFALNCGGPAFQLSPERLEGEIGPRLVALARALSAGTPPHRPPSTSP